MEQEPQNQKTSDDRVSELAGKSLGGILLFLIGWYCIKAISTYEPGSYPSKSEAKLACDKWVSKGGKYDYFRLNTFRYRTGQITWKEHIINPDYDHEVRDVRFCRYEIETRQYLGWDSGVKYGEMYSSDSDTKPKKKIVKHFRY